MFRIFLIINLFFVSFIYAQLSLKTEPKGFLNISKSSIQNIEMPSININKILQQDAYDYTIGDPYKFGHNFTVDINFFESATSFVLDNGDELFQLAISSEDAYSINMIFDEFYIPKGAELFIYNENKSHSIGAFTNQNNKYFNRFSTSPVSGDRVIIEYYQPRYVSEQANINISNIIHGYKDIFSNEGRGYNDSQACNNNVNCPEAQPWNDEISSIVMALTDGGTRLCSGALINNTNQDFEMYFLTSQTCLGGHEDWVFMFNYESPSCDNEDGPTDQTLSGATLLTHHHESDYALLRIEETPPEYFDVYFSGWDRRNIAPQNCISIHHPVGDIKKISYHEDYAVSDGWYTNDGTHWRVSEWDDGITEPGSYGAPLFNNNNHLVGQLHGGESSCDDNIDDYYGKLYHSWDLGLSEWLDPNDTGLFILDGIGVIETPDPQLSYSDDSFNFLVADDELRFDYLLLSNIGEDESVLDYTLYNSPFSEINGIPDDANYYWIDSDESDDYGYYWIDIDNFGNQVWFENNDESTGPFDIGFEFSFYDELYSEFIINPNGWIGFGDDNSEWDNVSIPSSDAPRPAVLAFWDDLNPLNSDSSPDMAGQVKYASDGNKLVVSYQEVVRWDSDDPYTFQIVIEKSGLISINYGLMSGDRTSATIGIQNESGDIGQQIIYNDSYMHNFLGVSFKQAPNWISIDNQNYIDEELNNQEAANHMIEVDGSLLDMGEHLTYLHIESNATGPVSIPVSVQVGYQSILGDINYDDQINVQDVVLLISIVLGNYSPNLEADINQDGVINVLDAVLLIDIILS